MEYESDSDTNCNWCSWIIKRTGGLRSWRTNGNYLNYCIIEIGQNIEKSSEDLLSLKKMKRRINTLTLQGNWIKLRNMKMTIIPIVNDALGTVTKELIKRLEGLEIRQRVGTIQTNTLLRSARTLRRVLKTWGDLLMLKLQWKTISSRYNNSNNINNNIPLADL